MSKQIFSPCGTHCNNCEWYKGVREPTCAGCNEASGKPFWGKCETYSCTQSRNIEHCGLCAEFPCREYMTRYDPREGPSNALMRAGSLAYRAKHGSKEALKLLKEAENFKKQ